MNKNKITLTIIILFFHLFIKPCSAHPGVKVWEQDIQIPTYIVGEPNKNPMFYSGRAYQGAMGPIYPYPLIDNLTDVREMRTYKGLFLENEYLKICVLPGIGGRIFYATDKTNGYEMIYRQHVIKPALIGMLGAWISGGVEWSIPHHHRATSFMPVDYTVQENPDGSKTIWVGELEIRHRMKWIIGMTLYPGKSILEATVKLFNRTPFVHSFLYWANVAVHANPGYQVIFPSSTAYATYHGKNQFTEWPTSHQIFNKVDYRQGVDVSWWKNNPSPTSMFAWDCDADFLAGYDHGKQAGIVHVADHHTVPGKKFWTWGTGLLGQRWEKILTDEDGPYLELMVGGYSDNQPDYSWIQPYETKILRQVWFPIRVIGGVKTANEKAAVNLEFDKRNIARFGFNTTTEYADARAVLESGDHTIYEKRLDIAPDNPFVDQVQLPKNVQGDNIAVYLYSSSNEIIIQYKPVRKKSLPMPEPVNPPPVPRDIKTVEDLCLTGMRLEQFYNPAREPEPYYEEALSRDPNDFRVNTALGIGYCKKGKFAEAETRLQHAIDRCSYNYTRPRNGEAHYYQGITQRFQGKLVTAYDAFHRAAWDHAFHSAAYYQLAELAALEKNYQKAMEYLNRSLATNLNNTRALNLKATILRKQGKLKQATEIIANVLSLDPLDFWAGNERSLVLKEMGLPEQASSQQLLLVKLMRDEIQSYLELAIDYGNCGFYDEAITVLARAIPPGKKSNRVFPMVAYYLGYYYHQTGDEEKAIQYYRLGQKASPDHCFPFRLESIEVLKQVTRKMPDDARAYYYRGNLLYDHQPEKAIADWEKSRELDDHFATVHRNLGLAYARIKNDISNAIQSLERAVAEDETDPRLYYELDVLYEIGGVSPQKRLALLEKRHKTIVQSDDAFSREVLLLIQMGRYDEAIAYLTSHHFNSWEEGGGIRHLYVNAYLLRGLERFEAGRYTEALADFTAPYNIPANLDVWIPAHDILAYKINYFIGTTHEAMGNKTAAKNYNNKVAYPERTLPWSESRYFQAMALRKLANIPEAETILKDLMHQGQKNLKSSTSMDFFAKFGEKQSYDKKMANAYYLIGLSYLGLDRKQQARESLQSTMKWNRNHLWAKYWLSTL